MKAGKYTIKWYYTKDRIVTKCEIEDRELPFPIGVGVVKRYVSDPFCRATARKLSLARALKNAALDKEARTEIWEAYRNMTKKKRW